MTERSVPVVEEEYLAGVRAGLADIPPGEVTEILDDVESHLADIRADVGAADLVALTARLGTPAAYAAELRAAAGYPPAPDGTRPAPGAAVARLAVGCLVLSSALMLLTVAAFGARSPVLLLFAVFLAVAGVLAVLRDGADVASVAALPEVRRLRGLRPAAGSATGRLAGFVAGLQPAWWLLRALLAAALVAGGVFGVRGLGPVLVVALVAAPVSVWLGRRSRADRRWLWAVVPLNALAVAIGWAGLLTADAGWFGPESGSAAAVSSAPVMPGLWQDGDRQVRDIRPFDAAGTPLRGVYLFDQDGRRLDTGSTCSDASGIDLPTPDPARPYPRGTLEFDENTGRCVPTVPAPLVVAIPGAPASTPAATTPAATAPAAPTPQPTSTPG